VNPKKKKNLQIFSGLCIFTFWISFVYTSFSPTNSQEEWWELVPGPHKMDKACISKMSATLLTSTQCKDSRGESISSYLVHTLHKWIHLAMHEYTIIVTLKEYPQLQKDNSEDIWRCLNVCDVRYWTSKHTGHQWLSHFGYRNTLSQRQILSPSSHGSRNL
jgi:hypothetical protein